VTATPQTDTAPSSFLDTLAIYLRPRVLIVLFLGFSSGLPLALSGSTLQVWMREAGVSLAAIGLFGLVGTPYTLKFLWAPLVDALNVPILSRALGRRRGWLVFSQILLMAAIAFLGFCDPVTMPWWVALGAFMIAAASATQDIVIDAFRVESLDAKEQPAGQGSYVAAYRVGMLISTAGVLYLVSGFEGWGFDKVSAWRAGYFAMALMVLVGIATTLLATEPQRGEALPDAAAGPQQNALRRVTRAAYLAFADFLTRDMAIVVLVFVALFKMCDAFAGVMTAPFVIDLGFSRNDYATVVKIGGFAATIVGGLAGGVLTRGMSLVSMLWLAIALQAVSNVMFIWLAFAGVDHMVLAATITVENFTSAIGTVIFVVYLSALCQSPLHTATQFALLSALAAVARVYISPVAGDVAQTYGWVTFFIVSMFTAVPSAVLLVWLQVRGHFATLDKKPA
jgi:PAT family beta-lactamase induction signal transducer AmpG